MFDERQLPAGLHARMADFSPRQLSPYPCFGRRIHPNFQQQKIGRYVLGKDLYFRWQEIQNWHWVVFTNFSFLLSGHSCFKLFLTTLEYKIQAIFSKNTKTAIQFTWFYQLYTQTHSSIPIEEEGRVATFARRDKWAFHRTRSGQLNKISNSKT